MNSTFFERFNFFFVIKIDLMSSISVNSDVLFINILICLWIFLYYFLFYYILHLFYLSRYIALTGYFFVIYCHWPKCSFVWYPYHILHVPVERCEPSCKSSSLHVNRKYQRRQSRDNNLILLFNSKYKRQWLKWFFCWINTI